MYETVSLKLNSSPKGDASLWSKPSSDLTSVLKRRPSAQLAELSQTAFLRAMESSLLVMGVIIAVAALVIGAWAPGRDGQQLRPARRITSLRRGDAAGRNQA